MLSARAFLLGIASADAANIVRRSGSPTPDMNVAGNGTELAIDAYAPQGPWHPTDGTLSEDAARLVVRNAFNRKNRQLATRNSIMLIGGFGCDEVSIDRLKSATEERLAPGKRRPYLAAVAFYVIASWTRFGGEPDARQAEGVSAGAHTGLVLNPGYEGHVQLRPLEDLPPGSRSARLVPNRRTWHVLPRGHVGDVGARKSQARLTIGASRCLRRGRRTVPGHAPNSPSRCARRG